MIYSVTLYLSLTLQCPLPPMKYIVLSTLTIECLSRGLTSSCGQSTSVSLHCCSSYALQVTVGNDSQYLSVLAGRDC